MEHERLLARIISGLVMEPRNRPSAGSRLRRKGGPPVIEVVGLGRSQQNALLEGLRHKYAERLPVNVPEVPLARGVVDSFWYLSTRMTGLNGPAGRRAPAFARFHLGLLAHAWAADHADLSLDRLQYAHRALVRDLGRRRQGTPPPHAELLRDLEQPMAGAGTVGALLASLSTVARFVTGRPRPDRVALRWWGRALKVPRGGAFSSREAIAIRMFHFFRPRLPQPGDPEEVREKAARQEEARVANRNAFLVAAFLADIDAHYGLLRRLNRNQPPLMLLQVQDAAGRAVLDAYLDAHRVMRNVVRQRTITHPVVLVVSDHAAGAGLTAEPFEQLEALLDAWTLRLEDGKRERRLLRVTVGGTAPPEAPATSEETARAEASAASGETARADAPAASGEAAPARTSATSGEAQ
ncbi:hypothetical protein [Streptomyces sp. DH24]|uniref:hypothetical protein n=1 Tax=Streptomyces sp. DH24 TaxID=3040123 RepID=UPI0024420980|nr:hypothetical protein [Streptomyces sp. DH24]MDG9715799.1 hypothetical protein [Streptomyces sp. DH24]